MVREEGPDHAKTFVTEVRLNGAPIGEMCIRDRLKSVEGTAKLLLGEMKKAFLSSTKGKLGALLVKSSLGDVKKLLDPSEVGGTPFLGISRPVLKAHGSSDARAIRNAVFRACLLYTSGPRRRRRACRRESPCQKDSGEENGGEKDDGHREKDRFQSG